MQYIKQRQGSMVCGPVAILNTGAWLGEKPNRRHIRVLCKQIGVDPENGVSGTKLDRWLRQKRNFNSRRISRPTHHDVLNELKCGRGVILQYIYEREGTERSHLAFLSQTSSGRIRLANPDLTSARKLSGNVPSFTYITKTRLAEMCIPGNRYGHQHPSMWVMNRDQKNDFIRVANRLNGA